MMLAASSLCAMAMFTACSEDDPAPTRAELCQNGLTEKCLIGSWNVNGFAQLQTGEMNANYDYTALPGTLTFKAKDKKTGEYGFQYDAPAGAKAEFTAPDCNPVYGTWTLDAGLLIMKAGTGSLCMGAKTYKDTPVITVGDLDVTMAFGKLYFLANATDELAVKNSYGETFSISAK